ncbi:hypothetical protein OF83DRAFT_1178290 [Amylostereum chailletii]|nr:hypothetical protein OF83DRAFT_1178290 [Amylostereum chailletii]
MQIHLDALRDIYIMTSQRRNVFAPIHTLPHEILLKIFDHAGGRLDSWILGNGTDSWIRHTENAGWELPESHIAEIVKITHVCHFWRELALDSPHLWTSLTPAEERSTRAFQQIVKRAKSAPLSLVFREDRKNPTGKNQRKLDLTHALQKWGCMVQVRHLDIALLSEAQDSVRRLFKTSMPLLEVLRLHAYQGLIQLPAEDLDSFAPRLRRLSLSQCTIDLQTVAASVLSCLTHFCVAYIPSEWGNDDLFCVPSLTSEALSKTFTDMSNLEELALSAPPFMYPRHHRPRTVWSSSVLLPPNLKHLTILGTDTYAIDAVNLASRFLVPVHTHVDFDGHHLPLDSSLESLLEALGGGPRAARVLQISTNDFQTHMTVTGWLEEDDVTRGAGPFAPTTVPHSRFQLRGQRDRDYLVPLSNTFFTPGLVRLILKDGNIPKFRSGDIVSILEKARSTRVIEIGISAPSKNSRSLTTSHDLNAAPRRPKAAHAVLLLNLLTRSYESHPPETGVAPDHKMHFCPSLETLIVHFHGRKNCSPAYFEDVVLQLEQLLQVRIQSLCAIWSLRLPSVLEEYAEPLRPIVPDLEFFEC